MRGHFVLYSAGWSSRPNSGVCATPQSKPGRNSQEREHAAGASNAFNVWTSHYVQLVSSDTVAHQVSDHLNEPTYSAPSSSPPAHSTRASKSPPTFRTDHRPHRTPLPKCDKYFVKCFLWCAKPSGAVVRFRNHPGLAERILIPTTCRYLRDYRRSEPLLYRHLDPDGNCKSRRRIQLLKTLGERHDLLPHTRSFRGHLIPNSIARPSQPTKEVHSRDSNARALLQDGSFAVSAPLLLGAVNIRDLEFTDSIDCQTNGRWELFKNAISSMKLRSVALGSTSKGPLDFTPVLRGQPELARLELDCSTAHFEGLGESDVRKLKVFRGTWRQAVVRRVGVLDLGCGIGDECHCPNEQTFQKLLYRTCSGKLAFKGTGISLVGCTPVDGPENLDLLFYL